jgi:hypothetical protein
MDDLVLEDYAQNWEKTKLGEYLLYGNWQPSNALRVLAGLEYSAQGPEEKALYEGIFTVSNSFNYFCALQEMTRDMERLQRFWNSDLKDAEAHYSPESYIDWALSKRFSPPWLAWAINERLYTLKQEMHANYSASDEKMAHYVFDKSLETYPPELDFAFKAWQEISTTEGKGKPKFRIKKWLEDNTNLSNEAKERIAIVANWDKVGGATRSD